MSFVVSLGDLACWTLALCKLNNLSKLDDYGQLFINRILGNPSICEYNEENIKELNNEKDLPKQWYNMLVDPSIININTINNLQLSQCFTDNIQTFLETSDTFKGFEILVHPQYENFSTQNCILNILKDEYHSKSCETFLFLEHIEMIVRKNVINKELKYGKPFALSYSHLLNISMLLESVIVDSNIFNIYPLSVSATPFNAFNHDRLINDHLIKSDMMTSMENKAALFSLILGSMDDLYSHSNKWDMVSLNQFLNQSQPSNDKIRKITTQIFFPDTQTYDISDQTKPFALTPYASNKLDDNQIRPIFTIMRGFESFNMDAQIENKKQQAIVESYTNPKRIELSPLYPWIFNCPPSYQTGLPKNSTFRTLLSSTMIESGANIQNNFLANLLNALEKIKDPYPLIPVEKDEIGETLEFLKQYSAMNTL